MEEISLVGKVVGCRDEVELVVCVVRNKKTYQSSSTVYTSAPCCGAVQPFWLSELPETFF
jgi:hypothetical protein